MSDPTAPGEVVVSRTSPVTALVMLAAVGFFFVGIVAALVSPDAGILLRVLLTPLALLLGIAVLLLLRSLVRPARTTLSAQGYRHETRGRTDLEIPADEVTGVRFWPGQQSTWAGAPDDPGPRLSRSRLVNRLEIRSARGTVHISDGRDWPAAVETVRGWVRERPHLVDDPDSISFLRDAEVSARPPEKLPRSAIGLTRVALRRGDPWAPFLPDAYGQWSDRWNGRYTAPRAHERGGTFALVWRWVFLWLPWVTLAIVLVRVFVLTVAGV